MLLALTYVFSLSLTYAIAGIAAASLGFYLQVYFQNLWVHAVSSVIIVALALSLLGFYKIKLPKRMQHFAARHNKYRANYHYAEVFVMGIMATLIASPCIAAPLAIAFGLIGTSGSILRGGMALFCIGLGIGTPLLAASAFNKELLPHAGKWQHVIKTFVGLAMIGRSNLNIALQYLIYLDNGIMEFIIYIYSNVFNVTDFK